MIKVKIGKKRRFSPYCMYETILTLNTWLVCDISFIEIIIWKSFEKSECICKWNSRTAPPVEIDWERKAQKKRIFFIFFLYFIYIFNIFISFIINGENLRDRRHPVKSYISSSFVHTSLSYKFFFWMKQAQRKKKCNVKFIIIKKEVKNIK